MSKCSVSSLNRFGLTPDIQNSINTIYNQIVSLVKTQGKSFSIADIYNVITATVVAVNSFFVGTDTATKITYAGEIVQQVLSDLSTDNIIPSEIGYIINFIPIQMIVDFVMKIIVKPPSQPAASPEKVLQMLSVKNHTGVADGE